MLKIFTPVEGHKPRLSPKFAWPIGVESISSYFADVPKIEQFQVWFSDRPLEYRWTMEKIAAETLSYQIFTVWYTPSGREPNWYFMVYPVERIRKARVKELLELDGLPWVHTWLSSEHTETDLISPHHFRCVFHPRRDCLEIKHDRG
jgi:hypothetical protein